MLSSATLALYCFSICPETHSLNFVASFFFEDGHFGEEAMLFTV